MTRLLALAVLLNAAPAAAQTPPAYVPPGASVDLHRYQADQHRYEMDSLRARAEARQAEAARLRTESRLRRMDIEARRQPEPALPHAASALRSPEQERAAREAATARRQTTAEGLSQIDAWLNRTSD